jgi:membrane fusion protein
VNTERGTPFRTEVLRSRAERLHGSVSLATPLAWQVIGFLLLAVLATATAFLFLSSYARSESVTGAIVLDSGVASIVSSRPGIIDNVVVREGQQVGVGAPLARVRSEEQMLAGPTAASRIRQSLADQASRLSAESELMTAAAVADRARLGTQINGLEAEIANLETQIADQRRLVQVATGDLAEIERVAKNGFISRRDVDAREAVLISRRQQLAQFEQTRGAKASQLLETRQAMAQGSANAGAQLASRQSDRAALAQQLAQAELSQGYTLTSPVAGIATGVAARLGQPVTAGQQLMMIVPESARVVAELYVPTAAAGFLSPGQEVRLAIDAYPYQRYGTIDGRIATIARAAIARPAANGGTTPSFLVTVRLARGWVMGAGRRQPLLPGMMLNARIVTERRTLIEWLFEPIMAVGNR